MRFRIGTGAILAILIMATFTYGQSSEDYKVYDAVVRHMFRDGITRFDMNAKVDQIVIRDRTRSEYASRLPKEDWERVKTQLRSLSDETIAGYESARKMESDLERKFDFQIKYVLIGDKQLRGIFYNPKEYDRTMEQWKEFDRVYPKSAGFNSFSRVGFDKAKRNALVYFVNWCGLICGTGTYVHVGKGENGWVVKESARIWIS